MTKEELKQEAEKFARTEISHPNEYGMYYCTFLKVAEPREKRIEELEAEVKEWKDKADLWCKTANLKDHNILRTKELEKENAELKAENEANENGAKKYAEFYFQTNEKLTKAKKLLKEFVHNYKTKTIYVENMQDLLEQAGQFLSEVEKC